MLSTIIARIRGEQPDVLLVVSYDKNKRVYNPPMPLLFPMAVPTGAPAVSETSLRRYLRPRPTGMTCKYEWLATKWCSQGLRRVADADMKT